MCLPTSLSVRLHIHERSLNDRTRSNRYYGFQENDAYSGVRRAMYLYMKWRTGRVQDVCDGRGETNRESRKYMNECCVRDNAQTQPLDIRQGTPPLLCLQHRPCPSSLRDMSRPINLILIRRGRGRRILVSRTFLCLPVGH